MGVKVFKVAKDSKDSKVMHNRFDLFPRKSVIVEKQTFTTMTANRIHPIDDVLVELYFDGKKVDTYEGSGFHTVEQAIQNAYDGSERANVNIEDYVFRVTNLADHTSARYRINAGGNVKILPEEP